MITVNSQNQNPTNSIYQDEQDDRFCPICDGNLWIREYEGGPVIACDCQKDKPWIRKINNVREPALNDFQPNNANQETEKKGVRI